MEYDPQDQDIVTLLTRLKDAGGKYPEDLLAARRQSYLTQIAQIGLGIGAVTAIEKAPKNGSTPSPAPPGSTIGSTLLETALIVAILSETSAVAYLYREKLSDFFQSIANGPRVQEVTPLPIFTTALEIQEVTPSPAMTSTLPSPTLSASPSGTVIALTSTPIPGVVEEGNPVPSQVQSTPALNSSTDNDPNGNNGNHYGQTPKPNRTKEPGSNNDQSSNNSSNSDQTPKDKPTKTK